MHVFIITDLEGISGVDIGGILNEDSDIYKNACVRLMEDTNAAIAGAFDGGADKVTVVDGHHTGSNFIKEKLDKRAFQIPSKVSSAMNTEEFDMDVIFAVGAHAMAGNSEAFLDHTQDSVNWEDYRVNGKSYGEMGQQAICFGLRDIPLVMMSGDEAACREAEEMFPGVVTACVKKALSREKAVSVSPEESYRIIYEAAKEAVKKADTIKPYKITLPATVEVTFRTEEFCNKVYKESHGTEKNGRILTKRLDKITNYLDLAAFL